MTKLSIKKRKVLLSTGELTDEIVIEHNGKTIYENGPLGATTGFNEAKVKTITEVDFNKAIKKLNTKNQKEFDKSIDKQLGTNITTPLSLAYLRLMAKLNKEEIYNHIKNKFSKQTNKPMIICNILNGGKHAGNDLEMCEFMIIPKGESTIENMRIASEVYLDLKEILKENMGVHHTMVGREGGFAPHMNDIIETIILIQKAIRTRNKEKCEIAIDVAANNFSTKKGDKFNYHIKGKTYSTEEFLTFYEKIIEQFSEITYLEDPFHEEDKKGWKLMMKSLGEKILVVADDLTVTNKKYVLENEGLFNAMILKTNQVGTFTGLIEAYNLCHQNRIKTIVSQRSGETDSNILPHIAVGLGSEYMKAGAPARERIVKYNELLRITEV